MHWINARMYTLTSYWYGRTIMLLLETISHVDHPELAKVSRFVDWHVPPRDDGHMGVVR